MTPAARVAGRVASCGVPTMRLVQWHALPLSPSSRRPQAALRFCPTRNQEGSSIASARGKGMLPFCAGARRMQNGASWGRLTSTTRCAICLPGWGIVAYVQVVSTRLLGHSLKFAAPSQARQFVRAAVALSDEVVKRRRPLRLLIAHRPFPGLTMARPSSSEYRADFGPYAACTGASFCRSTAGQCTRKKGPKRIYCTRA
mmetsp:Transcript_78835/g.219162  ORF Transcript_78835/g.219162 Transcript_78835/m.219162 type:complete len:200 (+) Transcript_78835:632-1231(+)